MFSEDESDSLDDEPTSKRKIKDDSDWEAEDEKPKRGKVKHEAKVEPSDKPKRGRKAKTETNDPKKPKRSRTVKKDAEDKPKVPRQKKVTARKKKVETEGEDAEAVEEEPKDKVDLKRKLASKENGEPSKKVKYEDAKSSNEAENAANPRPFHRSREARIVAHFMGCPIPKAEALIQMLDDEATVPFLIRYRKNIVGDWSPDEMRSFKDHYTKAKEIVQRAKFVSKAISGIGHWTPAIQNILDCALTMSELDDLYEPYKPAQVLSKFVICRNCGLDRVADQILQKQHIDLTRFVDPESEHRKTMEDVKILLIAFISETMVCRMADFPRLWREENWTFHCSKLTRGKVVDDKENFKKFYNFRRPARYVRADEMLAMNRGGKKKILKVSLTPCDHLKEDVRRAIVDCFGLKNLPENDVGDVLSRAVTTAQDRLMKKIPKKIQTDCTRSAEATAIQVFIKNLKRLLLTPPYRSDHVFTVLGIDPGKRNGCKTVVVHSRTLAVEDSGILHLDSFKKGPQDYPCKFEADLKHMIKSWSVEIIVLGNGVGCQEVETVINNVIRMPEFSKVRYTVIPEQGVSVYSCSKEAQQEYPDFKPEVVSSLSLVKRFFNPLNEYVKVEPKHLGVGMYQHDINEKKLSEALEETVSEIVSVVGVDLNTASLAMLKSISGLTKARAKAIIAYRNKNGPFVNRKELLEIKGIGPKTYQQCAGFVRIIPPLNEGHQSNKYNKLDQTIVHPEHYDITRKLLGLMGLSIDQIGTPDFIARVKCFSSVENVDHIAEKLGTDVDTVKLLYHALSMLLDHDIRSLAEPPDFKTRVCRIDQVKQGMIMSGRVENVTTFGAFVDIGVGVTGLLHFQDYNRPDIGLGDRVEVQITSLEVDRDRIGLSLKRKIADLFPMNKLI